MSREFVSFDVTVSAREAKAFLRRMREDPTVENITIKGNPVITQAELSKCAQILENAALSRETSLTVKSALSLRKVAAKLKDEDGLIIITPDPNKRFEAQMAQIADPDWQQFINEMSDTESGSITRAFKSFSQAARKTGMSIGDVREIIRSADSPGKIPGVSRNVGAYMMIVFSDLDEG